MALANCSRCGALFNKISTDYCKNCYEEEEKLLRKTQEFLRKNRNAALFEVVDAVEVEQWMIEKWVVEKRITINSPEEVIGKYFCSSCGREVKAGQTLCKTCQFKRLASPKKNNPEKTEKAVEEAPTQTRSAGMHFKPR